MGKQSNSYRLSVQKLRESDIKNSNADSFVDPDGVITELEESWRELVIALLSVLYIVKRGKLIPTLAEAHIGNSNLVIAPNKIKACYMGDNKVYQIPETNYYVVINMTNAEYAKVIKGLCKVLKFNPKECYLDMTPHSAVDQDLELLNKKVQKNTNKLIRLSDIHSHDISKLKVVGVQIGFETYNCSGYTKLIKSLTDYISKDNEYWYSRVSKYNVPDKIELIQSDTGIEIVGKLSKAEYIQYIKTVCTEFGIDTGKILILFKATKQ